VKALLDDRLRSLQALAARLPSIDPQAGQELAAALAEALHYPALENVFSVGGQPVLTFWGHRQSDAPALGPPPVPSPAPAAPAAEAVALAVPARAAARNGPRRWWALLLMLALLLGWLAYRCAGCPQQPPVGEPTRGVEDGRLEAARDEGARLEAELTELRRRIEEQLAACPLESPPVESPSASPTAEPTPPPPSPTAEPTPPPTPPPPPPPPPPKTGCVTREGRPEPIDLYLLQDLTGSFEDDVANASALYQQLVARAGAGDLGPEPQLGVGSFFDKPVAPFGGPGFYVFRNHLSLTTEVRRLLTAQGQLAVAPGGDEPEGQLEALIEMAGNAKSIGFRPHARKFVAVVTDAAAHSSGDWARRQLPPGFPPGLLGPFAGAGPEDGDADGDPLNEDYPDVRQVAERLRGIDVTPIFLVSGPALPYYRNLVSAMGRGVSLPIASDSSNLIDALVAGVKEACESPRT
jgi:hypothetical protein